MPRGGEFTKELLAPVTNTVAGLAAAIESVPENGKSGGLGYLSNLGLELVG